MTPQQTAKVLAVSTVAAVAEALNIDAESDTLFQALEHALEKSCSDLSAAFVKEIGAEEMEDASHHERAMLFAAVIEDLDETERVKLILEALEGT